MSAHKHTKETANAVSVKPDPKSSDEEKILTRKWGKEIMAANYTVVPSVLIRGQERLGINATELAVLINLLDHWWEADKMPWPSKGLIAERLQVSEKTVQRAIVRLETGGLLKRSPRYNQKTGGRTSNEYDLSPLVAALKPIAIDMAKADKDAQALKKQAQRPGWKSKSTRGAR